MTDELIVRREGAVGRLTLNRPAALGALTLVGKGPVDEMFAPLPAGHEWSPLPDA